LPVVQEKYRGTPVYDLVKSELITAAGYQGLATYQSIAQLMGLPPAGSYMGREVGHVLGEISEDEHLNGRPLLSALAVSVQGVPSAGFYQFARDVGRLDVASDAAGERWFWEAERKALYKVWRRPARRASAREPEDVSAGLG